MTSTSRGDRYADDMAFEADVRRVAELLYPSGSGGQAIIDNAERDGVFITDDTVVLIEATTSATLEKARKDGRKLKALADKMSRSYPYHAIKAFFVTSSEPTPHQIEEIRKIGQPVTAVSFSRFRSRLMNVDQYLSDRHEHAFGSARDPETDAVQVKDKYLDLSFVALNKAHETVEVGGIIEKLEAGGVVVLLGEYGAGKSMTLREIFMRYRRAYHKDNTRQFCIHLNLNEHQGQSDPTEALTRHAALVGYPTPAHTVRAWRYGAAHVALDGFDEVFVPGWTSGSRPLTEVRKRTVELVRQFVRQKPQNAGLLIAGRKHFFDSIDELQRAFALDTDALILDTTEFTEKQVREYLSNRKWAVTLPDWMPRRPLLIGYLAGRGLSETVGELAYTDAGEGWHRLLDLVCRREARQDAGIDEISVRRILERLASLARHSASGLGPLSFQDMAAVFQQLQGYLPDEGAYAVLQRLPGLRVYDNQANTRQFVDDDFADAARAGDILQTIVNPYDTSTLESLKGVVGSLGLIGLRVLELRADDIGVRDDAIQSTLVRISREGETDAVRADLVRLLYARRVQPSGSSHIADVHIPFLSVPESGGGEGISFESCIIDLLDAGEVKSAERLPLLTRCSIDQVDGVSGLDELGSSQVVDCDIREFMESTANPSAILRLDIPDSRRVALTVLRKIFVQSGHSRKESALYRGSLTEQQKQLVPDVLKVLESRNVIQRTRRKDSTFWSPNRSMQGRVRRILDMPVTTSDELLAGL